MVQAEARELGSLVAAQRTMQEKGFTKPSFFETYKWYLVGGAAVLVGGFFLLKK